MILKRYLKAELDKGELLKSIFSTFSHSYFIQNNYGIRTIVPSKCW